MSLSVYNSKRHFNETPEPKGKTRSSKGSLRFVIQKHDASHLHYDLRLEMEGVLKSWAVPKGPSVNPEDKRLAMMVEDHPNDYREFEGIIPEGNYGAGTVIVWDEGFYEPIEGENLSRKEKEKILLNQLHSGNIKIVFHGKKLKGEYALFLMKGKGDRSWILMKKSDDYSSKKDITKLNKSVKTGKTIAQVAEDNGTVPNHPEGPVKIKKKSPPIQLLDPEEVKTSGFKKSSAKKTAARKTVAKEPAKKRSAGKRAASSKKKLPEQIDGFPGDAVKSKMPVPQKPMLATLVNEAFNNDEWIFEIKWDGYRALAYLENGEASLISRNLISFSEKFSPVKTALEELKLNAVFDGEIIAINDKGIADFQMLQNWKNSPAHLQYYVFDILWLNDYDLTKLPLIERKKILEQLIPADHDILKFSDHIAGKGVDFFNAALKQGLEGIMAKKADSLYHVDTRTKEWVKIKVNQRQEVVIAGFTEPRNSRKNFGSLLLGVYEGDELVYVGHTGSGFDTTKLDSIYKKLKVRIVKKSPFKTIPKTNMPATWVRPDLVCEIKFTEWTKDRIARHPIFMGLREDKTAREVKFEKPATMKQAKTIKEVGKLESKMEGTKTKRSDGEGKTAASKKQMTSKNEKSQKGEIDFSVDADQILKLDGKELQLTNLKKPYWKKEKFLKGDMINFYLKMAPFIFPYLKDRPQSLNRHPNGIDAPNFFMKDTAGKVPEWMEKHVDFSESTNKNVEYLVCSNVASLIFMANMGCIEMNPWHSRTGSWEKPDWCLIDLDPDKTNSFDQVIDVALAVKNVLDSIGATSCVKTSGSSGIHIYIPLGAKYNFDQSKQLAELVVTVVNQQMPDITSVLRNPAKRKGKIYLDFLQNRQTQTAAAPYSLRPKPGVPVSTPLDWSEVKKGLTSKTWNAYNIFDRLKTEGDLFKPVLGRGVDMIKVLKKLERFLE